MDSKRAETLLIVDDSPMNRMILKNVFHEMYKIREAENGFDALLILHENAKDICAVLLDIVMPVLDGYGVLEKMRDDSEIRDIPVIIVTGSDDDESQMKALGLGAVDVITKPFNPLVMSMRVKNTVDRKNALQDAKYNEILQYKLNRQQMEIEKSHYDVLTGLYERRYFFQKVRDVLDDNPDRQYVMVRFDIDRFKVFNDIFGTFQGDKLLRHLSDGIRMTDANFAIYGRMNADHFCALFEAEQFNADAFSESIYRILGKNTIKFNYSVKIGIYKITDRELDTGIMGDRAYLALKSIKNVAEARYAYYNVSMFEKIKNEQELLSEMGAAFEQEQFEVWFQPQYNYSDGKMTGAEALVRWRHLQKGMIYPGEFIPIMESNGMITRLDKLVWEQVCRNIQNWLAKRDGEASHPHISVNISRADLLEGNLVQTITGITDKYKIPRELLHLEITESSYMEDSDSLVKTVESLRKEGYIVEMDDFGSGYSSLNTLKDVPVDILKLDMKFISGAQQTSRGGSVLSSIIRMSRWLELSVIAEGVETKQQAEYLDSIGCHIMQGYYFARPMPAEKFEPLYIELKASYKSHESNVEFVDADSFWNLSSQTALIFNTYLGGAAILEYCNGNLEMTRANDMFFENLGITRKEYEPWMTHVQDRFPVEYGSIFIERLKQTAETGLETNIELNSKSANGEISDIWTYCRIRLLAKSTDSMLFYIGTENISARKHAEDILKKQTMLLDSLYNTVPSGIMRLTLKDGIYTVSSYNKTLLGILKIEKEEDFVGILNERHFWKAFIHEDYTLFINALSKLMSESGCVKTEIEYRFTTFDGEPRWMRTVMEKTVTDTETCLLCVFDDITDRRSMEIKKYGEVLLGYFDEVFEVDFDRNVFFKIDAGTDGSFDGDKNLDKLRYLLLSRINTVVHPDDRDFLLEKFDSIAVTHPDSAKELPLITYRIITSDGSESRHSLLLLNVQSGRYLCCIKKNPNK